MIADFINLPSFKGILLDNHVTRYLNSLAFLYKDLTLTI